MNPLMGMVNGGEMMYRWPPAPAEAELVVPRVSNIISQIARPELKRLAVRGAAEYAVDEVLYWAEELPRDAAVAKIIHEADARRDAAGSRGTAIHRIVEQLLCGGEADDVDPDLLPYVAQAQQFLDDWMLEPLAIEATVYSRDYRYAGTADLFAGLRQYGVGVVDWKSGRPHPNHAIQLAGYANGEFIGHENSDTADVPECDLGVIVYLNADADTYDARIVDVSPTARPFKTFVAARTLLRWNDEHATEAMATKLEEEPTAQTA